MAFTRINPEIEIYINSLSSDSREIANRLHQIICDNLPDAECKIWHRHPVWFLDGNPIVGFSQLKDSVRLLFWSGRSFDEAALQNEGSFMAAESRFTNVNQVEHDALQRWICKARDIQWDYKNLVKRKGVLLPLKGL